MATFQCRVQFLNDTDLFDAASVPEPSRPPTFSFPKNVILSSQIGEIRTLLKAPQQLEDCALQLYKVNGTQCDYGSYLDLDLSLDEQWEELEEFTDGRKNSIVLRTQLSVRVRACIERVQSASGRDLRRALFSLKQIFQDDKDLVHEFVHHDGLECLIKLGTEADQNNQNYILRALGQVMLYVDGMNGVIAHNNVIRWLYTLTASKFRLVAKTALKLLLVFVEYTETNAMLLLQAINTVALETGWKPWANVMNVLHDKHDSDLELLVYCMTLINKVLRALPDQDSFYDVTDRLEEQGMEHVVSRYLARKEPTDLDLLKDLVEQLRVYESALKHEDDGLPPPSADGVNRELLPAIIGDEEKKSRRYSTGSLSTVHQSTFTIQLLSPTTEQLESSPQPLVETPKVIVTSELPDDCAEVASQPSPEDTLSPVDSSQQGDVVSKPPIDFRRSRRDRQLKLSKAQDEFNEGRRVSSDGTAALLSNIAQPSNAANRSPIKNSSTPSLAENVSPASTTPKVFPFIRFYSKAEIPAAVTLPSANSNDYRYNNLNNNCQDNSVIESATTGTTQNISPSDDSPSANSELTAYLQHVQQRYTDMSSNSQSSTLSSIKSDDSGFRSQSDMMETSTGSDTVMDVSLSKDTGLPAVGHQSSLDFSTGNVVQWEMNGSRLLKIGDMDFSDLDELDEVNLLEAQKKTVVRQQMLSPSLLAPPPPPPPPPPLATSMEWNVPPPPPPLPMSARSLTASQSPALDAPVAMKSVKTVKLHWRDAKTEYLSAGGRSMDTIWTEVVQDIGDVRVDTNKLEHLFELRGAAAHNGKVKAKQDGVKKAITVLDPKRSNMINIGLTTLPVARNVKAAILNMDSSVLSREAIEKILHTMMPSDEEKTHILEAETAYPDIPLGPAEQFLLTLTSIAELEARLKLWLFKLDFDVQEKEIAEALMDLKVGIEDVKRSQTFRCVLATVLAIGNFLNGVQCRGFNIDYLSKVVEVKDVVNKHPLMRHLVTIVCDNFPNSTDLFTEFVAIVRCSKVDWNELSDKLSKLEMDCKASWEHLRAIGKYESGTSLHMRLSEFLSDTVEKICVLKTVYRRTFNRFYKFLLYLGYPAHSAREVKVTQFCKVLTEFSLEYRIAREKLLQQRLKKAQQRERNKTRGKLIVNSSQLKRGDSRQDERQSDLEKLLHSGNGSNVGTDGQSLSLPGARRRARYSVDYGAPGSGNTSTLPPARASAICSSSGGGGRSQDAESHDDATGDDDMLEAVIRSAKSAPIVRQRDRRRARNSDRKSLRRTLKGGLTEAEMAAVLGTV